MPLLLKFACVAVPLWLLWVLLITAAAPSPPGGAAQVAFLVSTLVALAGCVWASWGALPQLAGRPWRRAATVALGILVFLGIAIVGHLIGQAVAGPHP